MRGSDAHLFCEKYEQNAKPRARASGLSSPVLHLTSETVGMRGQTLINFH